MVDLAKKAKKKVWFKSTQSLFGPLMLALIESAT
jgi:hypothetical protein